MGTIAAVKCREVVNNVRRVLATEMFAACQAIDFRDGLKLGVGTKEAYDAIREKTSFIEEDVVMYKELEKVDELIKNEDILSAVNKVIKLNI